MYFENALISMYKGDNFLGIYRKNIGYYDVCLIHHFEDFYTEKTPTDIHTAQSFYSKWKLE